MKTTLTLESETPKDDERMECVLSAEELRFALQEIMTIISHKGCFLWLAQSGNEIRVEPGPNLDRLHTIATEIISRLGLENLVKCKL